MNTPIETISGCTQLRVRLANGSESTVNVRQLPVDLWNGAIKSEAAFDEAKFIELVTGETAGFADSLSPRSRTEVAEEANRMNSDFFGYLSRRAETVNRIAPGLIAKAAAQR